MDHFLSELMETKIELVLFKKLYLQFRKTFNLRYVIKFLLFELLYLFVLSLELSVAAFLEEARVE